MTSDLDGITRYIEDAVYPVSKDDLIKIAERADAPEEVLEQLRALPGEHFERAYEVISELE